MEHVASLKVRTFGASLSKALAATLIHGVGPGADSVGGDSSGVSPPSSSGGGGKVTAGDSGGVGTGDMAAGDGLASAAVVSERWRILTHVVSTPASMIAAVIKPTLTNAR